MVNMNTIYGFKLGQSQDYDSAGRRVPVTLVRVKPNVIIGRKTMEKDGYFAWQVALGTKKHITKPLSGILKNLQEKISPKYVREIKITEEDSKKETPYEGVSLSAADIFNAGDKIDVSGVSKGKGFAGVMKRHGFHGGPKTHGQSNRARHPGSIGQTTTPGRVYRGKRMAGHMGVENVTLKNLEVFAVKPEENLLLIKGLVPGGKNGLLKITKVN